MSVVSFSFYQLLFIPIFPLQQAEIESHQDSVDEARARIESLRDDMEAKRLQIEEIQNSLLLLQKAKALDIV